MKKIVLLVLLVFLILDHQSYYYGFGWGIVSKKITKSAHVKILFAGSDLGNQGIIIMEDDIGSGHLIHSSEQMPIIVSSHLNRNCMEGIFVKKVLGYYFNKEQFIVKILSSNNSVENIEIKAQQYYDYYGHELFRCKNFNEKKLKYIDLDKSVSYFTYFRLVKNLSFLILVIMSIILLWKIIKYPRVRR